MEQLSIEDMFCEQAEQERKSLLTAEEKEWVKWLIKPLNVDSIDSIEKYVDLDNKAYIVIELKPNVGLRHYSEEFDVNEYFTKLKPSENGKPVEYKVKELGL